MIGEKAADVILADAKRDAPTSDRGRGGQTMAYDVPQLLKMSQAQLDDLFTKSAPGEIPDWRGEGHRDRRRRERPTAGQIATLINHFAWQGKIFDAQKGVLKNRILPSGSTPSSPRSTRAPSWLDGKECIVLDYSDTSFVAHWIRDEIRQIGPGSIWARCTGTRSA